MMDGTKNENTTVESSSEVIVNSVSELLITKEDDGLQPSNQVAPIQKVISETIVQDGPASIVLEETVVNLPIKKDDEGSIPPENSAASSPTKTNDENPTKDVESASVVVSQIETSSSPTNTDDENPTMGVESASVTVSEIETSSSPTKTDENPTKGVELPSAVVSEVETSSSPTKPDDENPTKGMELISAVVSETEASGSLGDLNTEDKISELESGTSANSSLNKPDEVAQAVGIAEASEEVVEVNSSIINGITAKDGVSNGPENNVPTEIRDAMTSYDSMVPIEQRANNDKTHSAATHQPSSQRKVGDMTTSKTLSTSKTAVTVEEAKMYSALVDTAAPFESVKEAVTKFGGIVDWKAHKAQTMQRRELVQKELKKVQEEIPLHRKQAEDAEYEKARVLKDLQDTKRLIEELKLNLEKAQTEEAQAKQDSELVQLRVREMELGIAGEASVAIKAQVDVAKKRHAAAVAELESVRAELKTLQEDHAALIIERDNAIRRAEEAVSASSNIEKTVEDLTLELISAREALEAAHTAHMEAEEHRIGAALARDQDLLTWEKELKQTEDELKHLNEKLLSMKDLQSKLDAASALLLSLKAELAAYMEAKLNEESENIKEDNTKFETANGIKTHTDVQAKIVSVKKEIEEVKSNIEKAKEEVELLKVAAVSLKSELETEKASLVSMQQREGMASVAVSSLEAEVTRTKAEIEAIQEKEKVARDQMLELPKALQKAAREAEEAKLAAQLAQEELRKVQEEEEQVKASSSTLQSRLNAALKEIDASKVSERLALAAVKALQESELGAAMGRDEDANNWVTIPLDEYYMLSKQAHDAEEEAGERVAAAISQIEAAKESESNSLHSLEELQRELVKRKDALRLATAKAELANQGKLAVEQELRKWRADNVQRRKANDAPQGTVDSPRIPQRSSEETRSFIVSQEAANVAQPVPSSTIYAQEGNNDVKLRRKKSFLPRIVMYLARKKPQSSK